MRALILTMATGLLLCVTVPVGAQAIYGSGLPGTGNLVPRLQCNQAWMGNGAFGFSIDEAIGGGSGVLVLSAQPSTGPLGPIPLAIDLNAAILQLPFTLTGAPGAGGQGTVTLPFPLVLPPTPSLAGLNFYAQAAIFDPGAGGVALTPGLRITLTLPPQIVVTSSTSGTTDAFWRLDGQVFSILQAGGSNFTDNLYDSVWSPGGDRLYVSRSGPNDPALRVADMTGPNPVWSTFSNLPSGFGAHRLRLDPVTQRLYTVLRNGSGSTAQRTFAVFDADPASPAYGQMLASAPATSTLDEISALSPDGTTAAILQFIGPVIQLVDADPASPTFGMTQQTIAAPLGGGLSFIFDIQWSRDGRQLLVPIVSLGSPGMPDPGELARYSFDLGDWVDHDPSAPGIQNLGPSSSPVAPLGTSTAVLAVSPVGDYCVVGGLQGDVARVDLDPADPTAWSVIAATGATLQSASAIGIDRGGTLLAVMDKQNSPPQLAIYSTSNMSSQLVVPLTTPSFPSNGSITSCTWR